MREKKFADFVDFAGEAGGVALRIGGVFSTCAVVITGVATDNAEAAEIVIVSASSVSLCFNFGEDEAVEVEESLSVPTDAEKKAESEEEVLAECTQLGELAEAESEGALEVEAESEAALEKEAESEAASKVEAESEAEWEVGVEAESSAAWEAAVEAELIVELKAEVDAEASLTEADPEATKRCLRADAESEVENEADAERSLFPFS